MVGSVHYSTASGRNTVTDVSHCINSDLFIHFTTLSRHHVSPYLANRGVAILPHLNDLVLKHHLE